MENRIIQCMQSLHAPHLKTIALTKVMIAAIHRYVDDALEFDISEESDKKHFEHFLVNKPLRPVPTRGIVEQAKQNGEVTQDAP